MSFCECLSKRNKKEKYMFVPEGILNIIYHYLNPHEFYLEELKNTTYDLYNTLEKLASNGEDLGNGPFVIMLYPFKDYVMRNPCIAVKMTKINILRERFNSRGNDYGLGKSVITNNCYLNY